MSGTLAALLHQRAAGSLSHNHDLLDHCNHLMTNLSDPYFRIMLAYVIFEDWPDILDKPEIPLRGRLSLALRFLDDKALMAFLKRTIDTCKSNGTLEGLALTGVTPMGLDILQQYVDVTGDVQTAAIISSLVSPVKWNDARVAIWIETYRDLLDRWKLFHYRCQFDIDRGSIIRAHETATPKKGWPPRQFMLRCGYCNEVIAARRDGESNVSMKSVSASLTSCSFFDD